MNNLTFKQTTYIIAIICFCIYVLLLIIHPQTSWYDETYWTDLGYNMGINGKYYTGVWGPGQPSYSPLYAMVLACWFKIFGFSYFNAHFPAILMVFASYIILSFFLYENKLITSKKSLLLLSCLFWFAPEIYWIYNCGRVDVLSVLLSVCSIKYFVESFKNSDFKNLCMLFTFCFLMLFTGFQGVFFTCIFILLYFILNFHESIYNKKMVYFTVFIGYSSSLVSLCAFMLYNNCLKAFIRTTFNFSNLVNYLMAFINYVQTGQFSHNDITFRTIEHASSISELLSGMTLNGITFNLTYWAIVLCTLICLFVAKYKKIRINKKIYILPLFMITTPIVFIILGRYATYYTWTGYLAGVCAFVCLADTTFKSNYVYIILSVICLMWFILCPYKSILQNIDIHHNLDNKMLQEISEADINFEESTFVPYEWYYYLMYQGYEKMYFKGSGRLPLDLNTMILDDEDYNTWSKRFELQEIKLIGGKRLCKIKREYIPTRY